MQKGENYNHPEKGSSIKVDPIKNKKDIQTIKKQLADKPHRYMKKAALQEQSGFSLLFFL